MLGKRPKRPGLRPIGSRFPWAGGPSATPPALAARETPTPVSAGTQTTLLKNPNMSTQTHDCKTLQSQLVRSDY